MLAIGIAVFGVAFGALAVAYATFPVQVRLRGTDVVAVGVLGPAGAATFLDVALTGLALWDAVLLAGFVAAAGFAAAHADRRAVAAVAAAVAAAAVTGSAGVAASAVGLGVAAGVIALQVRLPGPKALAGSASAVALLQLRWPAGGAPLVGLAVLCAGVLVVAALADAERVVRRRVLLVAGLVAVGGLAAVGALGVQAVSARRHLTAATDTARVGLAAARDGRLDDAATAIAAAGREFEAARADLSWWPAAPARLVPVAAQNRQAMLTIAAAGAQLAEAAGRASGGTDAHDLRLRGGRVDLDQVVAARRSLAEITGVLRTSAEALATARSAALLAPVDDALRRFETRVGDAHRASRGALVAVRALPDLLGADGPRQWFVGIQDAAESRATGGIIGSYAVLTTDAGRIDLGPFRTTADLNAGGDPGARTLTGPAHYLRRYGRFEPERTWQNVNLSPDGPTVARVIEQLLPQSGGPPVDGVLLIDHVTLAAVLRLTGPVAVPGWPTPIGADNVGRVLLHEQFLRFPQQERRAFLADIADVVFERFTTTDLPDLAGVAAAFTDAASGRHVVAHSTRPREQVLFRRVGIDGALPAVDGDFLAVVTQNASGNKIDWFLRRTLRYEATVDGDGEVAAIATVRLENRAPRRGLPDVVLRGSGPRPTTEGTSRVLLGVFSPLELRGATVDGEPLPLRADRELGRNVYEAFVEVPAGATVTVELRLRGRLPGGAPYLLDVRAQPTVVPDEVHVRVWEAGDGPESVRFAGTADRRIALR